MTEHEDLIAEAHEHLDKAADAAPVSARQAILTGKVEDQRMSLVARLAHALEKVSAERDATRRRNAEITRSSNEKNDVIAELEAERDGLKVDLETKSIVHECCEKAQERDQLAAVVEQVREFAESKKRPHVDVAGILPILDAAPSVEIDRVKAEAWEEGADATCAAYAIVRTRGYVTNPYRKGESNE